VKRPTDALISGDPLISGNALIGTGVLAALAIAALVPPLRVPVLVGLALGSVLLTRGSAAGWAFAAGTPVAVILVWGDLVGARLLVDDFDCADALSPVAWLRVAEAAVVIGAIALLARRLGTSVRALGLRRPSRREAALGFVAIVLVPLPSLYIGAVLAEPFFGPIHLDLARPMAIVPALTLAVANGSMEELAYRGALMSWMTRAMGPTAALIGQAVIFGLAHTGTDYIGPALPVVLAVVGGGLVAGLIVRRTGSLWLAIAVHIALDVPLYYAAACRFG
jgi:membrane protease YdiL (CAAX protease family)